MKKLFKIIILLASLTGLSVWGGNAYALVCTSNGAGGGNWNAAATWLAGCGAAGPVAGDTVTISTGDTVTLTANAACADLTVNGILNLATFRIRPTLATTIAGTINLGTSAASRFAGMVTINTGGVWSNSSNVAVNFRGGLTNNGGTFTAGTGIQTFSTAAQAIGGTSPIVIPNLTVTLIALTNNGNLTVSTALAGTGRLVNSATGTLNIGGTSAITTLTATAVGNTVNYTGAAAQTVKATAYYNLGLGGGGIKTITGITVANNLTLSGTASATPAAAFVVGGNLDVGVGSTFTSANFTNSVTGTTSVSGTLAHTGVAAKTYIGSVTINAGGIWTNAGNAPITLQGGLTHNGATFTAGTGIYTFNTTAAQSVNCAVALTIPRVTVTTPTVLTNNCALTVSTALAGTGSLVNSAAGTLNIQGTSSITTLTNQGTATITGAGAISTVLANFTNTNTGTLNLNGTGTIAGITNNGIINLTSSGTITALTNNTAGTLNISAVPVPAITTLTANAAGNTVNYTGAGAQTAKATAYSNLILSTSGAKTMTSVTAIGGDLSISGTATMTANAAFTVTGALNYSTTGATTLTAATPVSIGSFNQSAGTLIDNGNTITVTGTGAGTWTQSGGTFTPTGTVTFTGAAPQIGASSFNNLTINIGAGNTATLTGNATSGGTLTLTSGTLAVGANTLTLNGPTIAGTPANLSTTSSSSLVFGGTSAGVQMPGSVNALNNLNVNNINGITLNSSPVLSGTLTLVSGIITTGANTLELASSCATGISGGAAATFVLGNLSLHYPIGNTTCTFPIGSAAAYTPTTVAMNGVTSILAASGLTARTDAGDHADTTAGASGIDATKSVNRYWTLTPGALLTFTTYDTTFTFMAGDIDGGAATASFIIGRKNGVSWSYPTMGAKNPTNITATGMTQAGGFGVYVIGERTMPSITVLKTVAIYWDPINLLVNPKFIPGAAGQFTIISSNAGGPADKDLTYITDPIPANTSLYVNDIGGPGPVLFSQGATSSTLAYTFNALNDLTDDVDFSNDGGTTWTAVPVAGADGCDATITNIRINPKGTFVGSAVVPQPSFQLGFRVCVK